MPDNFEIKHYIWLIILVVATLFFAQQTGIQTHLDKNHPPSHIYSHFQVVGGGSLLLAMY